MSGFGNGGDMTPEQRDRYDAEQNAIHQGRDRERGLEFEVRKLRDALQYERDERASELLTMGKCLNKTSKELETAVTALGTEQTRASDLYCRMQGMQRMVSRAVSHLVHGEAKRAVEILRQTLGRIEESTPAGDLGCGHAAMLRPKGRFHGEGQLSLVPMASGLVVRFDDSGAPEFWCEVSLPADELLRQLAAVFRLANAPQFNPVVQDVVIDVLSGSAELLVRRKPNTNATDKGG